MRTPIVLTGADLVLPDRILLAGTIRIEDGRVAAISTGPRGSTAGSGPLVGHTIVPGFIDVHVHGVAGIDTLDAGHAVERIAAVLPRFGVTAFCPTTVACAPEDLRQVLAQVRLCRATAQPGSARVLPAHLESNFINPVYRGAQPTACLRLPQSVQGARRTVGDGSAFTAADVLQVIESCASDIAIVTMAPEMTGGLELVSWLVGLGVRVSLGHSGATLEQAVAAIAAGASQATHLFNRMAPLHHRRPGLVGAVLADDRVAVELICDGTHVHPALVRMVVAAKRPSRVMVISDGTAAAALPAGAVARLGGQPITATATCAELMDGTMAGSVLTMDGAFRRLIGEMGFSRVDAALMCSTTPATELGLADQGCLVEGAVADLVVLDDRGAVVQTYVAGRLAYARDAHQGNNADAPAV